MHVFVSRFAKLFLVQGAHGDWKGGSPLSELLLKNCAVCVGSERHRHLKILPVSHLVPHAFKFRYKCRRCGSTMPRLVGIHSQHAVTESAIQLLCQASLVESPWCIQFLRLWRLHEVKMRPMTAWKDAWKGSSHVRLAAVNFSVRMGKKTDSLPWGDGGCRLSSSAALRFRGENWIAQRGASWNSIHTYRTQWVQLQTYWLGGEVAAFDADPRLLLQRRQRSPLADSVVPLARNHVYKAIGIVTPQIQGPNDGAQNWGRQ